MTWKTQLSDALARRTGWGVSWPVRAEVPTIARSSTFVGVPCRSEDLRRTLCGYPLWRAVPVRMDQMPADSPERYEGWAVRQDDRNPDQMRTRGGFFPRGTDPDMIAHFRAATPRLLNGWGLYPALMDRALARSGVVSFSSRPHVLGQWIAGSAGGYIYHAQLPAEHSFRMGLALARRNRDFGEVAAHEIATPGCSLADIVAVDCIRPDYSATRIYWPFTPRAGVGPEGFARNIEAAYYGDIVANTTKHAPWRADYTLCATLGHPAEFVRDVTPGNPPGIPFPDLPHRAPMLTVGDSAGDATARAPVHTSAVSPTGEARATDGHCGQSPRQTLPPAKAADLPGRGVPR